MTSPSSFQKEAPAALWESFQNSTVIGYLAVILATACWGMLGIFIKFIIAGSNVSPLALAFWRDLATFVVLFSGISLLRPADLRVQGGDIPWLLAVGAGVGAFHVFWNVGIVLYSAAVTTVQQAAMPAIVAIVAWFLWRDPLTLAKILAIILTFVGTVLVSGLGMLGQIGWTLAGLLVGFGLPIAYASWNLLGKKIRHKYKALTVLTYAFGAAAFLLLPFQFFARQPWPVSASVWLWFAGLIGVSTLTGFAAYTFGLGRLPASVASILAMAEIVFVVIFAYVFLGEWLAPSQVIGAGMVVFGVLLLIKRKKKRKISLRLQTR